MIKNLLIIGMACLFYSCKTNPVNENNQSDVIEQDQLFVTDDIDNFWNAYDAILNTKDTLQQMELLQDKFIAPASLGQKRMMEARNYSAEAYLEKIKAYPKFWNSLRKNTANITNYNNEINIGLEKLKTLYPEHKQATVYYTMGLHRSPGTGVPGLVMLGTEYALGNTDIDVSELNENQQNYYKINPTDHIQLLAVHEFVHTQQKAMVHNLLSLTLYEGIAEFVAQNATQKSSPFKAFIYGPENTEKVKNRFIEDMYKPNTIYNWLWNSPENEFGTGDLAYYVGTKIASIYYEQSNNKQLAIKELIELDYSDEAAVEKLVDQTNYFGKTLNALEADFEASKPRVVKINGFKNKSTDVDPSITSISIEFSTPMNKERRGFDYGPLGEENVLKVQKVIGFSEDAKTFTFEVKLEPGKKYQSLITHRFLSKNGIPMVPFLIEFTTRK